MQKQIKKPQQVQTRKIDSNVQTHKQKEKEKQKQEEKIKTNLNKNKHEKKEQEREKEKEKNETTKHKVIIINGEKFLDYFPEETEESSEENNQINSVIDTGSASYSASSQKFLAYHNQNCALCNLSNLAEKIIARFPCGHWSHIQCLTNSQKIVNQNSICPSCSVNTLDVGNDPHKSIKMQIQNGKQMGIYDPDQEHDLLVKKNQKNKTLVQKVIQPIKENIIDQDLNFKGVQNDFLLSEKTIRDYFTKEKNISDFVSLTGVRTREILEKKGLTYDLITKKFFISAENLLHFGIDRQYIMSKISVWNLPVVNLVIQGNEKLTRIHPVDYMYRRGFTKDDFIKLGWINEQIMMGDAVDKLVIEKIFENQMVQQNLPQILPQHVSQRIQQPIPQRIQQPIPQRFTQSIIPQRIAQPIPQRIPQPIPQMIQQPNSQRIKNYSNQNPSQQTNNYQNQELRKGNPNAPAPFFIKNKN